MNIPHTAQATRLVARASALRPAYSVTRLGVLGSTVA